jgi:hypothetical protein
MGIKTAIWSFASRHSSFLKVDIIVARIAKLMIFHQANGLAKNNAEKYKLHPSEPPSSK